MDRKLEKSFSARYRKLIFGCTILITFLIVILAIRSTQEKKSVRLDLNTVTIGSVEKGILDDFMILRLAASPRDTIFIDATEGGSIKEIFVNPGDKIESGAPLVNLTNTQLELQVLEQEGRLIESMTQLQNYQNSLELNRLANEIALNDINYQIKRLTRAWDRASVLVEKKMISRENADQIWDELQNYKVKYPLQLASNEKLSLLREKQLPQLDSQLETLNENLIITRSKLDNLTVSAPYDGMITSIDLKVGQTLHQGERLAQLTLNTGFTLTQSIDEFYLPRLQTDQLGRVEVDNKNWTVKLVRIYPKITNGTFTVDFEFVDSPQPTLVPGQTVLGKLFFAGQSQVQTVFIPTGPYINNTGGNWIFALSADGKTAKRRTIKSGRRNSEQIEILEGLSPGEKVILSNYDGLEDIDHIKLQ